VQLYTTNAVLNNNGIINAGAGLNPAAIYINGQNNTINLNGHSEVHGLIVGVGSNNGNVLSLNSRREPDGAGEHQVADRLAGRPVNFSGSFTVRAHLHGRSVEHQLQLSSYQLLGLTPNQQAIGAALDSALVNPTATC